MPPAECLCLAQEKVYIKDEARARFSERKHVTEESLVTKMVGDDAFLGPVCDGSEGFLAGLGSFSVASNTCVHVLFGIHPFLSMADPTTLTWGT